MTLSDKRKELKKTVINWWFSEKGRMNKETQRFLNCLLDLIKEQDKEFIKELKEELKELEKVTAIDTGMNVEDVLINPDVLRNIIDELAGDKLI